MRLSKRGLAQVLFLSASLTATLSGAEDQVVRFEKGDLFLMRERIFVVTEVHQNTVEFRRARWWERLAYRMGMRRL